jgi:hypothetical protein
MGVPRPTEPWHPTHPDAWDDDGNLRDLTDEEAVLHRYKPEAADAVDSVVPLAAEDSVETPEGVV